MMSVDQANILELGREEVLKYYEGRTIGQPRMLDRAYKVNVRTGEDGTRCSVFISLHNANLCVFVTPGLSISLSVFQDRLNECLALEMETLPKLILGSTHGNLCVHVPTNTSEADLRSTVYIVCMVIDQS